VIQKEIGWNTRAMAMRGPRDGIEPSTASCVLREFAECPECGSGIDPDVTDGLYEDRDVIWTNNRGRKSAAHSCENCGTELRMFVEEKAFGRIGPSQLPENAAEWKEVIFIPIEDSANYLVVNTNQFWVTPERPQPDSAKEQTTA
jgi:hypothetical protein